MKFLSIAFLVLHAASSKACCTEPSTIIHIKNYEGPIYLQAPQSCCEERILHLGPKKGCDFDCNCVSKTTSTCIPINTASQCTPGSYNVPYPTLYQDTCVNTPPCTGLYNVGTHPLYQDNQYCPVVQITPQNVYCPVIQDDSYICSKCGKKFSC